MVIELAGAGGGETMDGDAIATLGRAGRPVR